MNTRIIIDKNVRHGKPRIRGTRVTVEEVLGALAGGMTFREIEKEYGITDKGIRAAIQYVAAWIRGEEVRPFAKV